MSNGDSSPLGRLCVMVSVYTDRGETLVKAAEVFGRAAAGLALEGIEVSVTVGPTANPDADS